MTSSSPVPMSDVDVPLGRQISNRGSFKGSSFRKNSIRRSNSLTGDSIPADEMITRAEDEEDPANSSLRLSAALAAEREETRIQLTKELEEEDEEEDQDSSGDDEGGEGTGASKKGVTMSLMDLLVETDRQAGIEGPTYRFDEDEEEEEEEVEEVEEEEKGGGEVACCVCMVKHKGIPLVPCGHTYCRMCSREMWVHKGHCPACASFVSEVLDIF